MQTVLCHLKQVKMVNGITQYDGEKVKMELSGVTIAVIHDGAKRYIGFSVKCVTDQVNRMKGRLSAIGRAKMIRDIDLGNPVPGYFVDDEGAHGREALRNRKAMALTYGHDLDVVYATFDVRDKFVGGKMIKGKLEGGKWTYTNLTVCIPDWMLEPIPEKEPAEQGSF